MSSCAQGRRAAEDDALAALGAPDNRRPAATTIGRAFTRIDPDALDDACLEKVAHGRRELHTIQVRPAPKNLRAPHAAQVFLSNAGSATRKPASGSPRSRSWVSPA